MHARLAESVPSLSLASLSPAKASHVVTVSTRLLRRRRSRRGSHLTSLEPRRVGPRWFGNGAILHTVEIYIQEIASLTVLPNVPPATRYLINMYVVRAKPLLKQILKQGVVRKKWSG